MRVIAGTAKRLMLKTMEGMDTRPTTDRIKETLFNMLAPDLYGCSFLDLFAGSGGIGIEALSRGGRICREESESSGMYPGESNAHQAFGQRRSYADRCSLCP